MFPHCKLSLVAIAFPMTLPLSFASRFEVYELVVVVEVEFISEMSFQVVVTLDKDNADVGIVSGRKHH